MGENEPRQNIIDFEPAGKILMKEGDKKVLKTQFESPNKMMYSKSYIKHEDVPENKETFIYGFKHIQTDKIDSFILIGGKSNELYENDKVFIL